MLTKGAKHFTLIDLMIDFVRHYDFGPDDLAAWEGDMLITVAGDDVVLCYFDSLRERYPHAAYHVFPKLQQPRDHLEIRLELRETAL